MNFDGRSIIDPVPMSLQFDNRKIMSYGSIQYYLSEWILFQYFVLKLLNGSGYEHEWVLSGENKSFFSLRTFSKGFFLLTFNRELVKDIPTLFALSCWKSYPMALRVSEKGDFPSFFRTSAFV